jgi:hypothetical protein
VARLMARIRSLHPGQWTDEAFVSCAFAARLLALGLRNEADDNGIFEWKPKVLRMRLFPADDVSVEELLGELVDSGQVKQFQDSGKLYGAIRNFRIWQRPKSAKTVHPFPDDLKPYVGIFDPTNAAHLDDSEPASLGNGEIPSAQIIEFPQNGEIPSQMKEVGGKREEGKEKKIRRKRVSYPDDFEVFWKAYPTDHLMSKKQALDAWKKLDAEDRVACLQSVPAFKAYCKSNPSYRALHCCRYISQRRFDGMLEAGRKITERQQELRVFVAYDSPQWWEWDKHLRATTGRGAIKSERSGGWHFPSEWPPKDTGAQA